MKMVKISSAVLYPCCTGIQSLQHGLKLFVVPRSLLLIFASFLFFAGYCLEVQCDSLKLGMITDIVNNENETEFHNVELDAASWNSPAIMDFQDVFEGR